MNRTDGREDHELVAHDPWLRRLARRLVRSRARADDLVQDTYVTALRNAPPDVQLRPWLRAVMRKLAWGQLRGERRRTQREESFSVTVPALAIPEALLDHGVDRERLTAALRGLPEPFQSTIVQRFFKGRSCADIARSENVPAGTVRWRQARGLELLRAELRKPRRRFALWALPFAGAGEPLVARGWRSLALRLGSSKGVWLWLACGAAVIYAVIRSAGPLHPPSAPDGIVDSDDDAAPVDLAPGLAAAVATVDRDPLGSGFSGTPAVATSPLAGLVADGVPGGPGRANRARAPFDGSLEVQRDDCPWDPVNGRRCAEPASTSSLETEAACARVRREILAGEAVARSSRSARGVVTAAVLANRALAQRLGCPLAGPGDGGGPVGASGTPPRGGKPGCVTETGADGAPCTVCPGEPRVCATPECHPHMTADGSVCTTCVDSHGQTRSDCPGAPPGVCHSEIADSGLLCTTCDGLLGPPECLPAECSVIGDCLRCVDPKGRVEVDCSVDYGTFPSGSYTSSATNSYFSSCNFTWGVPEVSGTTCHYPGQETCVVSQTSGGHCLSCRFSDGSGLELCMDAAEPLPDPLDGRPLDLPAPGTCTTDLGADGDVACATCTHADLSATTSCHYTGLEACKMVWTQTPDSTCVAECRTVDGSRVSMCNSARGPAPRATVPR